LSLKVFSSKAPHDMSEYVISSALKGGASFADFVYVDRNSNMISLTNGKPEKNISGHSAGAGLRTIDHKGRQGVAYVNSFEDQDLRDLVDWSINNCRASEPDPYIFLYDGDIPSQEELGLYDKNIEKLTPEDRLSICSEMTEIANEADGRVISVRSASWADGSIEVFYSTSKGFRSQYRTSYASSSVAVVLEDNGKREMGGFGDESRNLASLDHRATSRLAVERTAAVLGGAPVPTGKYDIVLDPESTVDIIEILGDLFLSSNIYKGRSLLRDKKGLKVGSPEITIIDDGRKWGGMGTSPFDGEGYPSQRTVLMEKGVVSSFLYNLKYANIFGVESTGNASRGLSSLPDVDITNLYIKPGNKRPSDILSGISRGIYVMELLGLHTIDPVSGDFSLGIKGILVEKGQMTRPVSGMTIAGNIVEILDLVETVGNDLRFFGNIGGCTLVVNNVSTTGS